MSMRVDLLGSIQKCICKARACSYLITGILRSRDLKMSRGYSLDLHLFAGVLFQTCLHF